MGKIIIQSGDKDGDNRQFSIEGSDALANGTDYAAVRAAAAAVVAAVEAIQRQGSGNEKPTKYWALLSEDTVLEPDAAVFPNSAQVNTKWQVEYILNGVSSQKKHIPIPIAHLDHADAVVTGGRVELPIGSGVGAALKTALEAYNTDMTVEAIFHDERG